MKKCFFSYNYYSDICLALCSLLCSALQRRSMFHCKGQPFHPQQTLPWTIPEFFCRKRPVLCNIGADARPHHELWRIWIPRDECRKIWPRTNWDILGRIAWEGEFWPSLLKNKTSGQRYIQRIRVHLTELVIISRHEFVYKAKIDGSIRRFAYW